MIFDLGLTQKYLVITLLYFTSRSYLPCTYYTQQHKFYQIREHDYNYSQTKCRVFLFVFFFLRALRRKPFPIKRGFSDINKKIISMYFYVRYFISFLSMKSVNYESRFVILGIIL